MATIDNRYLNIPINNLVGYPVVIKDIQATYDVTLTEPLLDNPSDYYASIVRFTIPINTIPIFSFPVDISQNNPNVSALLIGIGTTGGVEYPQNIVYIPRSDLPVPTAGSSAPYFTFNQITSEYYFIYSIQAFINMVNTALAAAVTASGIGVAAPYYVYTPQSQLFSLIVSQAFLNTNATIFMNELLLNYFDGFFFDDKNTIQNGLRLYHNLNPIPYGSPVGGPYQYFQEYTSLPLWFDIRKVVITTSSLPVVTEANPGFNPTTNSSANYIPIITDFAVTFNNISDINTVVTYNPTAQYRLVDMKSNVPLTRIQLTINWLSKSGYLYPLFIAPNQSAELKIGFFRKELYRDVKLLR